MRRGYISSAGMVRWMRVRWIVGVILRVEDDESEEDVVVVRRLLER